MLHGAWAMMVLLRAVSPGGAKHVEEHEKLLRVWLSEPGLRLDSESADPLTGQRFEDE